MLVDAHERESQVRLTSVPVRISTDQAATDEIAQQRAHEGIRNRRPQHEARHAIVDSPDANLEIVRDAPQYARETDEQHGGAEQADGQVRGQIAELVRVFAHALVRVHAHRATGGREPERATRRHPQCEQIAREPFAQAVFRRLGEPALGHVQHEQHADDPRPHAELIEEVVEVAAGQRIVERLVPAVQHDLPIRVDQDRRDQDRDQDDDLFSDRRGEDRPEDHADLTERSCFCSLLELGGCEDVRLVRHRAATARRAVTQEMNAA